MVKNQEKLVIAIDGPSGVGKTTVAKMLAERLGLAYIDTGAMYRAVAVAAHDAGVDLNSDAALEKFCKGVKIEYGSGKVTVNGVDLTPRLRTTEAGALASRASASTHVRRLLVAYQQALAAEGGVVMEGRDIGTVVLPGADFKFFLDAPHETRARRRHAEGADKSTEDQVGRALRERDRRDATREASPLKKADDAILIDTGPLDAAGVLEEMLEHMKGYSFGDIRS